MTTRSTLLLSALLMLAPAVALGQGQPPVQSPQDAACRNEAANRVFSVPNPRGLDPYVLGGQIWTQCMRQAGALAPRTRQSRHGRKLTKRRRSGHGSHALIQISPGFGGNVAPVVLRA